MDTALRVNGTERSADVEPRTLLVELLREQLGLTGTKVGCETGECGACTVLLDGVAVKSCMVLAVQADGSEVTTIEGLSPPGGLNPVQEAFWEEHAVQDGFVAPGEIMSVTDLLRRNPDPDEAEIRAWLDGNLGRVTGYHNVVRAVEAASSSTRWAAASSTWYPDRAARCTASSAQVRARSRSPSRSAASARPVSASICIRGRASSSASSRTRR